MSNNYRYSLQQKMQKMDDAEMDRNIAADARNYAKAEWLLNPGLYGSTNWSCDFLNTVRFLIALGRPLSAKQQACLDKMYKRCAGKNA